MVSGCGEAAFFGAGPYTNFRDTTEHEVFAMLAQGHTSAFIAETAGINPGTTKAHIAHIYQKLDVHSKDEMLELVEDRIASGQMDLEDES